MRNVIIRRIKDTSAVAHELYELRLAAFEQWKEKGLNISMVAPMDYFTQYLSEKTVFVAQEKETGELLAMHTFRKNERKGYVSGSNLAVTPKAKHEGIATRMLTGETELFRKAGYRYIHGSTAIPATWSVRWHLKNGYYINGYRRQENKNFASYTFCKPINLDVRHHPLDLFWTRPLAPITARTQYIVTYIITSLCKTRSGKLTSLGRLAKRIIRSS